MSRRELKSLQVENTELTTGTRSGKTRRVMDGETDLADKVRSLETDLAKARGAIVSKDGELESLRSRIDEAKAESDREIDRVQCEAAEKVRTLEQQLESECVQAELAMLRALEALRANHQLASQREKDAIDEERKRMSAWIKDVKDTATRTRST